MTDLTIDDVDEEDLLGNSLEDVPKIAADGKCRGRKIEGPKGEKVFAGYCGSAAGKETDHLGEGRCKFHGGTNSGENGQGVGEDNTNAVTHGAYVAEHKFYNEVLSETRQAIVDVIFEDYLEEARSLHGDGPDDESALPIGDEVEIFDIAVMHGKHLNLEDWPVDRPSSLESGNALVERETKDTEYGQSIKYSESVVAKLQLKLSRERRAKLKHYGLDKSSESEALDSMGDMLDAWKASASDDS